MQLNIPHCKQKMTLLADATIQISTTMYVGGNCNLLSKLGLIVAEDPSWHRYTDAKTGKSVGYNSDATPNYPVYEVTFPKGTVLQITQMYIRNGGWNTDCINVKIVSGTKNDIFNKKIGVITIDLEQIRNFDVDLHEEDN